MLKKIFLILTGEDEKKKPRSKKLLELVRISGLRDDEYKIVVSGLSSFNLNVKESETKRLSDYLIQENIPKSNIILEEESMDTLGNMVFSHKIIERLVRKYNSSALEIILVTEGFHMNRSKKLFLKVFNDLKNLNPNINFIFESANTKGISSYFWKRKLNVIFEKYRKKLKYGEDVKKYLNNFFMLEKKYSIDYFLLDAILTDVDFLRLKRFEDFENYLYSLPVYNQKYDSNNKFSKYGFYANLIRIECFSRNIKK